MRKGLLWQTWDERGIKVCRLVKKFIHSFSVLIGFFSPPSWVSLNDNPCRPSFHDDVPLMQGKNSHDGRHSLRLKLGREKDKKKTFCESCLYWNSHIDEISFTSKTYMRNHHLHENLMPCTPSSDAEMILRCSLISSLSFTPSVYTTYTKWDWSPVSTRNFLLPKGI